jgi:mono/diheme cytochrome c family protein
MRCGMICWLRARESALTSYSRYKFARFSTALIAVVATTPLKAEEPLLERDVLPILTKNCMGCHGGLRKQGGLDLRTIPSMLAGGDSGPVVVKGEGGNSELWLRIASDEMPAGDDREKLSPAEKETIKAWIDAGMPTVSAMHENVDPLLSGDKRHDPVEVAEAIDKHIDAFLNTAKLQPVAGSDDVEFMRRLYLDLTGRVPTAEQATEFLDSDDPDKRAKLIDTLLETPEFGNQFGRTWRDWVCPPELPSDNNGGAQPHSQADEFGQWLGRKVAAGESWDKITREILTVEGEIKKQPQVIFYGLVGQGGKTTPEGTARAVASLFMGVQLQCSQCHDDPYRDWSQQQHWGLAAFFGRSQGDFKEIEVGKGPSKQPGEITIPDSAFKNSGTIVQTAFLDGKEFQAKNNEDLRRPFVDWLTAKENPYFAPAFVNRMWFYLFARGIVSPIDDFRELNPPSHPGLMKLLAGEFTASGYDVKHLFRCLCNSRAYQRTSAVDEAMDEQQRLSLTTAFGRMPMRVMTADMLLDSLKSAYGEEKEFDLRGGSKVNTTGQAATLGSAYLEFHRMFGTNEEDATDFTHGIAQMLTMINHPRLLEGSKAIDDYLKQSPDASPLDVIEWLYLSTLSRRPTAEEATDAERFVNQAADADAAYVSVLWMLVNNSEFMLIR